MSASIFPRSAVVAACQQYGPQLKVDPSLNGSYVMQAIASNESSIGANCGPRHEPAYDQGGSIYRSNAQQRQLVADFGAAAASSYGPWQMMFINFDRSVTPPDLLLVNLGLCAENFVRFFNSYVIGLRKAVTIRDIGEVWNEGHETPTPPPCVEAYVEHLQLAYSAAEKA